MLGASLGIGSTYLFMIQNDMLVKTQEVKTEKSVLKDVELTYADIELSALQKWKQQGFLVQGGFGKPGVDVAGKPGCLMHSCVLTRLIDGKDPAISEIEVCGKQFKIGDVITLNQLIKGIRGGN